MIAAVACLLLRAAMLPNHAVFPATAGAAGIRQKLASLGLAGVVAYGLLNTAYYTAAFFFIWRYVARVPRGALRYSLFLAAAPIDCTNCTTRRRPFGRACDLAGLHRNCTACAAAGKVTEHDALCPGGMRPHLQRALLTVVASLDCTGLGLAPTAAKFVEVAGLTWAGSQITKVSCRSLLGKAVCLCIFRRCQRTIALLGFDESW